MCGHIVLFLAEFSRIPEQMRDTLSSQAIYQYFVSNLPNTGFIAAEQRDWKTVFKHLHSKFLTSSQRASWYIVMHRKIRHRELLYNRNVIDEPYCDICPGEPETVVHKIFRCQRVRDIWQYQRRQLLIHERSLARLEPEDFLYPNFRQLSRVSKQFIIRSLAIFFSNFM